MGWAGIWNPKKILCIDGNGKWDVKNNAVLLGRIIKINPKNIKMKIKEIEFKEVASKRIYESYMERIGKAVKPLPINDQNDVLLEFNSHIYEGLQRQKNKTEIDGLLDILDKLGIPEEVLKPLVADKKMEQATKTFNPLHIIRALALNITNGFSYLIFFMLYLLLFGFVYLIFAKIVSPDEV
ncbi:hypothetical protein LCGC14_2724490, partial [marine sediment metagenome]